MPLYILGSLNMDLVQTVSRAPRPGETLSGGDLQLFPGGKGANQACAVARLGGRAAMIGMVGEDPFGARLLASLADAGCDTFAVGRSARATGAATILVLPDGESQIVVSPGANETLTVEQALASLRNIGPGDLLLCQLETPVAVVEAAVAFAKRQRAVTMLDPAPAQPLASSLYQNLDLLTPNQSETLTLLERSGEIQDFDEAREAALALRARGPQSVIVKLGALGCLIAGPEGTLSIPGFPVPAIDTTAAGDTFNGALATALSERFSLAEAARFACAAAALSVTRPGAQSSIPLRAEVDRFLEDQSCSR